MRKPEQRLWDRFSDNVSGPRLWLQRIENVVAVGMPDVVAISDGAVSWIEMKYSARPARESTPLLSSRGLTPEQRNWHLDWRSCGGTSFVLIGDDQRALYLIEGYLADEVNQMTVARLQGLSIARSWVEIKTALTRKQ